VKQHGKDAPNHAAMNADAMLEIGRPSGVEAGAAGGQGAIADGADERLSSLIPRQYIRCQKNKRRAAGESNIEA
jgi:hypothetical protein